ncbi:LysE family translocator [uncultured Tateyamaria sp.]|uniref:LysE family translocator n=1 Tax=uncultured Tateyamaria sp. TaxID=455651 RepID=UPI00263898E2|nr:LysE family translocator [uncultured Tateyamaria sp.]
MDPILFIAFLTTSVVFLLAPGPSVAFATAQALRHGRRAAFIAVAGDALGTMVHVTVAVAGLTALVVLSEFVLPFLQIVGGIFILFMAWHAFRSIGIPGNGTPVRSDRATFWAGFFACVTNPKAIVFFVALFPAFMSPEHSVLLQGIVYGTIFIVLDACSILTYALVTTAAVGRAKSKWLNADVLSGLGLSVVGIAMIIKGYRAIPTN